VIAQALQPADAAKAKGKDKDKGKKNGAAKLKTIESAPPSADIVGNVPSVA
jgi:hypothetical protein